MPESTDKCEPKIHEWGQRYEKTAGEFDIEGAWNFVIENHGTTKVMLDNTINLEPLGQSFSVRTFTGNGRHVYEGVMRLTWDAAALDTDYILVICTYGGGKSSK